MSHKIHIVVVSAPSGAGKTSVCRGLLAMDDIFEFSISLTSRPIRGNEIDGLDYFFVGQEEFERRKNNNELIEWEFVHGNWYGTERKQVDDAIKNNKILLLDVDVNGALSAKKIFGNAALTVYIDVPENVLRTRLTKRGTESEEQILKRIGRVPEEIIMKQQFDFVVVNHNLEKTIEAVYHEIGKGVN